MIVSSMSEEFLFVKGYKFSFYSISAVLGKDS